MRRHGTRALAALLALACSTSGCMSLISSGPTQQVTVQTDPPGAYCTVGTAALKSPGAVSVDRARGYTVYARLDGYRTGTAIVESHESAGKWIASILLNGLHGVVTFFISTVLGVGVDIASGALSDLEPRNVFLRLEPDPEGKHSGVAKPEPEPVKPEPAKPAPARPEETVRKDLDSTPLLPKGRTCKVCGAARGGGDTCRECGAK